MSTTSKSTYGIEVIGIPNDNLDRPLFRIFPLWFFEDMLRVRRLMLVPPTAWEDTYEDIASWMIMSGPDHSQKPLSEYLCPAFAQSWSFEGESDALLRAYSRVSIDRAAERNMEPRYEGVQVRTTPRRLLNTLLPWAARSTNCHLYLGQVEYLPETGVPQRVVDTLSRIGPYEMGRGESRARSLLLKREAFRHEAEVRVLCVFIEQHGAPENVSVNLEPNAFIDEVTFDPRLRTFERIEHEDRAKALGYTGAFTTSAPRYQRTFIEVVLPWNWKNWKPGATAPEPP